MQKRKLIVVFGGRSTEHEISILSARNIVGALDRDKYSIEAIKIDNKGVWQKLPNVLSFYQLGTNSKKAVSKRQESLDLLLKPDLDTVIFPVLHGVLGEDGTIQGLLKLANLPFVGAGVLGSAIGMDKEVMKRLLKQSRIPVANFLVVNEKTFEQVSKKLGLPFFVKPANAGSSVGVAKVQTADEFREALKIAGQFDSKILAEQFIEGREIEVSVLGNENPVASIPGEIICHHDFYDYEAKYLDENGAELKIPADLPDKKIKKIQKLAIKTFKALCCEGMARVDFFLKANGEILVNEINTIPGFTNNSMFPKLWEASGMSTSQLLNRLIELALERFARENKLSTSYSSHSGETAGT